MTLETYHLISRILFWSALLMILLDAYFVLFHKGVPNIRTAPAIRRHMIAQLKAHQASCQTHPYTIIDVGSGNGLLTREIARAFPEAKVIGLEIAPQSVAWANWMKKGRGLDNLSYQQTDFNAYQFAQADAVVTFMIPAVLSTLGQKLQAELKPGAMAISNKFKLGGTWLPAEKHRVKTLYLHQGDVYLYKQAPQN